MISKLTHNHCDFNNILIHFNFYLWLSLERMRCMVIKKKYLKIIYYDLKDRKLLTFCSKFKLKNSAKSK